MVHGGSIRRLLMTITVVGALFLTTVPTALAASRTLDSRVDIDNSSPNLLGLCRSER